MNTSEILRRSIQRRVCEEIQAAWTRPYKINEKQPQSNHNSGRDRDKGEDQI